MILGVALEGFDGYWAQEEEDGGIAWRQVVDGGSCASSISLSPLKIKVS